MRRANDNPDNFMFVLICVVVFIFAVIPAWYAARAGVINRPLLTLAEWQLRPFTAFSDEAQAVWAYAASLDPAALSWEQMSAVLSYTGAWIRWPFTFVLCLCGLISIFLGRIGKLVRRFNMESLLRNNAESFPCLWPVIGRGEALLDPASYDSGPWRLARSPLQFAVEHGLLLDEKGVPYAPEQVLRNGLGSVDAPAYGHARLDEARTRTVLREQLGPVFGGFYMLSPCRQALAAAFLAYAGGDKQRGCLGMLDAVSCAYEETDGNPACPLLGEKAFRKHVHSVLEKYRTILEEAPILRHSAFELPWFMALLTRARKKGVLASSQFLWLRPLDRPLWYALHQCGGRTAWAEGFAAWAHYVAEERVGKALTEAQLSQAVASLREALDAQGWLGGASAPKPTEARPAQKPIVLPMPQVWAMEEEKFGPDDDAGFVYAQAEPDPEFDSEYDANAECERNPELY